jgi:hypothetical protein
MTSVEQEGEKDSPSTTAKSIAAGGGCLRVGGRLSPTTVSSEKLN